MPVGLRFEITGHHTARQRGFALDSIDTPRREGEPSAQGSANSPSEDEKAELNDCCVQTIKQHALYNPMMVCTTCKQIIKCFREDRSYRNYLTFCESRRRPVTKGIVDGYYTVVFRSYETHR